MLELGRWIKFFFARLWDFVFLMHAGMAISLAIVVMGGAFSFLAGVLPLPIFLKRWLLSVATYSVGIESNQIALALALIFLILFFIRRWRRPETGSTVYSRRVKSRTRTPKR